MMYFSCHNYKNVTKKYVKNNVSKQNWNTAFEQIEIKHAFFSLCCKNRKYAIWNKFLNLH